MGSVASVRGTATAGGQGSSGRRVAGPRHALADRLVDRRRVACMALREDRVVVHAPAGHTHHTHGMAVALAVTGATGQRVTLRPPRTSLPHTPVAPPHAGRQGCADHQYILIHHRTQLRYSPRRHTGSIGARRLCPRHQTPNVWAALRENDRVGVRDAGVRERERCGSGGNCLATHLTGRGSMGGMSGVGRAGCT